MSAPEISEDAAMEKAPSGSSSGASKRRSLSPDVEARPPPSLRTPHPSADKQEGIAAAPVPSSASRLGSLTTAFLKKSRDEAYSSSLRTATPPRTRTSSERGIVAGETPEPEASIQASGLTVQTQGISPRSGGSLSEGNNQRSTMDSADDNGSRRGSLNASRGEILLSPLGSTAMSRRESIATNASTAADDDYEAASQLGVGPRVSESSASGNTGATTPLPNPLAQAGPSSTGHPAIHPALSGLPGAGGGPGSKQQPSFVCKLYTILEDEATQHMVQWTNEGTAFKVLNPLEFSRVVLPVWFKHRNFASFVRQLNMYGFHKSSTAVSSAGGDDLGSQVEFRHYNFRRGDMKRLAEIRRKSSRPSKQQQQQQQYQPQQPQQYGHAPKAESVYDEGASSASGDDERSVMAGPSKPPSPRRSDSMQLHTSIDRDRGSVSTFATPEGFGRGPYPPPGSTPQRPPLGREHSGGSVYMTHANVRLEELSDRVDAIIRHSTYLEGQCRSLTEQARQAQANEQAVRMHTTAALERIAGFCSSIHRGDRDYAAVDARSSLLDAALREIDGLRATLRAPPLPHRQSNDGQPPVTYQPHRQ